MASRKRKYKLTFSKVELKIPSAQKKRLKAYCLACNTTPNKIYRKVIREFIDHHVLPSAYKQQEIIENQMTIFDICEDALPTVDIEKE
jgi:hypothetical protein